MMLVLFYDLEVRRSSAHFISSALGRLVSSDRFRSSEPVRLMVRIKENYDPIRCTIPPFNPLAVGWQRGCCRMSEGKPDGTNPGPSKEPVQFPIRSSQNPPP